MRRQLLWLLAGLVALPLMLVATAPELVRADPSAAMGLLGVVLAAGIPGLLLLVVVAVRRRSNADSDGDDRPTARADTPLHSDREPPETP